jgi:hypothetical protein
VREARLVICPYCERPAHLVTGETIYPHRRDLWQKWFWLCDPCKAYVGCHKEGTKPLGRLANAELRAAKQEAHAAFDPLWQFFPPREGERSRAYKWLADHLGISKRDCHIGEFDVETCRRVVAVCRQFGEERRERWRKHE